MKSYVMNYQQNLFILCLFACIAFPGRVFSETNNFSKQTKSILTALEKPLSIDGLRFLADITKVNAQKSKIIYERGEITNTEFQRILFEAKQANQLYLDKLRNQKNLSLNQKARIQKEVEDIKKLLVE